MVAQSSLLSSFISSLWMYDTSKRVRVKSRRLAVLYYFISLAVLAYTGIYSLWINLSYQVTSPVGGEVTVKTSGFAWSFEVLGSLTGSNQSGITVLDATDISWVEGDSSGVVIATATRSLQQKRGTCAGNSNVTSAAYGLASEQCASNADCSLGLASASGVQTGNCVTGQTGSQFCEVDGWCPPLSTSVAPVLLEGVDALGISVRILATFPAFLSRIALSHTWDNFEELRIMPGLNYFNVSSILGLANLTYAQVQATGANILVTFFFDCNWDLRKRDCVPFVSAARIDTGGLNMTFSQPVLNSTSGEMSSTRLLSRNSVLRIRFQLLGSGGTFDANATLTAIGSLLWFLSMVPVVIDMIAMYLLPSAIRNRFEKMTLQKFTMKMDASGRGDGREVQRGPGHLAGIQEEVPPPQEHIPPVSAGLGTRGGQSLFYANPGWLFNKIDDR